MYCKNCPTPVPAVALPDVACKSGTCGKLISWYNKFCDACSETLDKCVQCGAKL